MKLPSNCTIPLAALTSIKGALSVQESERDRERERERKRKREREREREKERERECHCHLQHRVILQIASMAVG